MKNGKILLLSCCAPCSAAVIDKLARDKADFTVLFCNPNIYPTEEYLKRRDEQKRLCAFYRAPFVELPYDKKAAEKTAERAAKAAREWSEAVCGLEREPERGKRCAVCFLFRLRRAAAYAKENGYSKFTSVLGVSRHKDWEQVNAAARAAAKEYQIEYDFTNWRRGGLEETRRRLIKELKIYEQTYCGCQYSHNY